MPRFSILQSITLLLLVGTCIYVANNVARYLIKADGGYGHWSVFTSCSKTCDGGVRMRKRKCNDPFPRYGGRNCSALGPRVQVFACNRQPCPVNGAYGQWGEFGECSLSCGGGVQVRKRNCDSPAPRNGKNCQEMELGPDQESKACNEQKCPVNGGYTVWDDFTECSQSCGGGARSRDRTCTNPVPDHGGKDCTDLGPSQETESCNIEPCPTTRPITEPTTNRTETTTATNESATNPPETRAESASKAPEQTTTKNETATEAPGTTEGSEQNLETKTPETVETDTKTTETTEGEEPTNKSENDTDKTESPTSKETPTMELTDTKSDNPMTTTEPIDDYLPTTSS